MDDQNNSQNQTEQPAENVAPDSNQANAGNDVPASDQPNAPEPTPVIPVERPIEPVSGTPHGITTNAGDAAEKAQNAYNISEREKEIESKKKRFDFITRIIAIVLIVGGGLAVTGLIGLDIFNRNKPIYIPDDPVEERPIEPSEKDDIIFDKKVYYKSDFFRLNLQYPERAVLVEKELDGSDPQKLEIYYDEFISDEEGSVDDSTDNNGENTEDPGETNAPEVNEDNLKRGFIVRITLFDIQNRGTDEIALTKLNSMRSECPASSEFSEIYETELDNIVSREFTVRNCDHSYILTFVPRFNLYYEIQQIYSGDIGYEQKFKSITNDIVESIDFYLSDEEIIIDEPYKTIVNDQIRFRLRYPSFLKDEGYSAPAPIVEENYTGLITVGQNVGDTEEQNLFGIFAYILDKRKSPVQFDVFYENQIKLLESDYKVATSKNPDYEIKETIIGGKKAFVLEGLSWRGHKLVFINVNGDNGLIFVIQNNSGENFDRVVSDIFDSVEFF